VLVGTLRGQDLGKGLLLAIMVLGTVLITVGEIFSVPWFRTLFQFFSDVK
jgi:hypothetical protein